MMLNNDEYEEERVPFSDPMFNRGNEIFQPNNLNNDNFNYYYYEEEEDNKKKILIPIISLIVVGIIGYFGFNYLQKNNKKNIEQFNKKIENKKEIVKENKSDTEAKEIIASILKEKEAKEKEKAEAEAEIKAKEKEKAVKVETEVKAENKEPKPKKIISPTIKNKNTSENIEDIQKKVIQTLMQNAKPKKHKVALKTENEKIKKVENSKQKEYQDIIKTNTKEIKEVEKNEKDEYKVVTVKKGDSLASISKRFYGNSMLFKKIIRANKDIKSASSHLHIGQKIIVPILKSKKIDNKKIIRKRVVKKKRVAKKKARRRIITVRRGDTLSTIAKRFYGNPAKYYKIVNANYKIKSKHTHLYIGQRIYVPR